MGGVTEVVTAVKNQGQCGSCWAFSATQAVESQLVLTSGGYRVDLSAQQITSCTPCTSGGCRKQDLWALAAAMEATPVSVCVNAENWNDYTGGVMSSAACGSSGASYQDHCVLATGFNSTAPTPYWIVKNSWSNTWGE